MNIEIRVAIEIPYFATPIPIRRPRSICSAVSVWPFAFACCAVWRAISASNTGSIVLNVRATITPVVMATNSIGSQALLDCQRRNTPAGEKKMSIRASQNDDLAGGVVTDALADSVI